mmetsp:Transcript_24298/g.55363  ORF Transcript_24298/g.55363 Transcript_24298/m.55363 type:complete len:96 (-) Transcript_24298:326-613(-)
MSLLRKLLLSMCEIWRLSYLIRRMRWTSYETFATTLRNKCFCHFRKKKYHSRQHELEIKNRLEQIFKIMDEVSMFHAIFFCSKTVQTSVIMSLQK